MGGTLAGARPVARRPRGGDRRPRRGALRRQHARGVCGDGGRDVRPPAERRDQRRASSSRWRSISSRASSLSASPGARGRPPRISRRTPRPRPPAEAPEHARLLLVAIALSGFAAMVDEVTWARLVGLVFGSSVYAFGLMLLLFLAGIAIGSALFARIRRAEPARVLGLALLGNTFAALAGIAFVPAAAGRLHARLSRREGLLRARAGAATPPHGAAAPADRHSLRHRISRRRRGDRASARARGAASAA